MITFDLYSAEYKIGAACPFDNTSLSFIKFWVSFAWNFNPDLWKNKTDNISAIDAHEDGCPLLVTWIALIASILSKLAIS